jgi:DNA-directed RNA polymerase sigma subunit (sigma70/sigma32)
VRKRRGSLPHDRYDSTEDTEDLELHQQQEIVDPLVVRLHRKQHAPLGRYSKPLNQIPQEQWVEVARRHADGESLRVLGRTFGVSHEAIRQIIKRFAY